MIDLLTLKFPAQIANCVGAAPVVGGYRIDLSNGTSRNATAPEIAAAQAAVDQDAADDASIVVLKSQVVTALARLQQIQTQMAGAPTNAQVINAVKDAAQILERFIRITFRALT